jgi:hypothetical protein
MIENAATAEDATARAGIYFFLYQNRIKVFF